MRSSLQSLGFCIALLVAGASGCATEEDPGGGGGGGGGGGASLTVDNESSFTIIEINLSPVGEVSFGADLLGAEVLEPGDSFIVSDLDCDVYDIRLLDEDNDECILTDIDLCFDNAVWTLDDAELAACQF